MQALLKTVYLEEEGIMKDFDVRIIYNCIFFYQFFNGNMKDIILNIIIFHGHDYNYFPFIFWGLPQQTVLLTHVLSTEFFWDVDECKIRLYSCCTPDFEGLLEFLCSFVFLRLLLAIYNSQFSRRCLYNSDKMVNL